MSKKLTEEQQKVWDRLKHGIEKPVDIEEQIAMMMAKQISDEIDQLVLQTLFDSANLHK